MRLGKTDYDTTQDVWVLWFAWRPVRMSSGSSTGQWIWMERVFRARRCAKHTRYWDYTVAVYRCPDDVH